MKSLPRLPPFRTPSVVRSGNMRAIRGRGNRTTELRLAALLASSSIRGWTLHPTIPFASPDLLFYRFRVAVFVDGCFWHGCPRCGRVPKTNAQYWAAKIRRNVSRDRRDARRLRKAGFMVLRIRECQLRRRPKLCLDRLRRALHARIVLRARDSSLRSRMTQKVEGAGFPRLRSG